MPQYDTMIRNGLVVDGTGAAGVVADVALLDGRVAAVGPRLDGTANHEVDATGLVVAPGFVDVHTHYDAQVLWDPDLTPTSWHGVTTVVMGNCGFGLAPTRADDRHLIPRILENVEGMSRAALEEGIEWTFETFSEYLDAVDAVRPRLNVAVLVGHTPVRLYVMGSDADKREATADEISSMRSVVREALKAGAVGFATSRARSHVGIDGRPVPSRLATRDEIHELAHALTDAGKGILEIAIWAPVEDDVLDGLVELSEEIGRRVSWSPLLTMTEDPGWTVRAAKRCEAGDVWPQMSCRPMVMQIALDDPFPFESLHSFEKVLSVQRTDRLAVYSDPAWQLEAREDVETDGRWASRWPYVFVSETDSQPELVGRSIADLAAERGQHPFDVMIGVAVDDGLCARFSWEAANHDDTEVAELLSGSRSLIALSDGGAHASQVCDACYPTYLLATWVRDRGVLTLEEAVRRLTSEPATAYGIPDRGVLEVGNVGDIVVFDPVTVDPGPLERVHDLPAGADRLIARSTGVEHVWVRGEQTRRDGADLPGVRPGGVLRDAGW